jgi:hypothetical protein
MKNKFILGFGIGLILAGLTGCTPSQINYQGKLQNVDDIEEILADMLEMENPNLDLEVTIYQETEND